jgi:sulfite exporter TauE/SafE
MNTVWLALITGLTTGGISCFAVQGGLLATSLTNQEKGNQRKAILYFLIAKLISYSILGVLLGLVGASLVISPKIQGLMQIFAGLVMLITVGRLLDLHPVFRKFVLTPPKRIFRILRAKSIDQGIASSAILGFLTVLIPCGVTQAMMLLSVASGSPIYGGLILSTFVLGTSPVFFALGLASNQILQRKSLKYLAATAIFLLGIMSINTGQILRGSVHTLQNYWAAATGELEKSKVNASIAGTNVSGVQEVEIKVTSGGYKANSTILKAGVPVRLKLTSQNVASCARSFTIPEYNISKVLPETGVTTIDFTPTKAGRLTFTCSMGMYTGFFDVIKS